MNNLAPIEDKELEEIFDRFVQPGTRYVNDIMDELLSWRDNHQKALYQRLAAEAVDVERWVGDNQSTGHAEAFKAIPLSKLASLFGEEG